MKIVICGPLKSIEVIKKIAALIRDSMPTDESTIIIPDGSLSLFEADVTYINHISEADLVLIVPKAIEYDAMIITSRKRLNLKLGPDELTEDRKYISNNKEIDLECVGPGYSGYDKIIIGESTTYEMAVANHLGKPYRIVADNTYIPGGLND